MGDNFAVNYCTDDACFVVGAFDGANFENNEYANGHNEAEVDVMCNRDDWANDEVSFFAVIDTKTGNKDVHISVNSEVKVPLWNDGKIQLHYDFASKHWSMTSIADGHDWSFCDASAVVVKLASALQCFATDDEIKYGFHAQTVVARIADQMIMDINHIARNSEHYIGEVDCTAPEKISDAYQGLLDGLAAPQDY